MNVTLTIHSPDRTWEVPITGSVLTLGRTDADVLINDGDVSRLHASINLDGDRIWIIDEGSTNGTLVNREPVAPNGTPLSDGDEIDLGGTAIVVSISHDTGAAWSEAAGAQAPATGGPSIGIIAAAACVVIILSAAILIVLASPSSNDNGKIQGGKYLGNTSADPTP